MPSVQGILRAELYACTSSECRYRLRLRQGVLYEGPGHGRRGILRFPPLRGVKRVAEKAPIDCAPARPDDPTHRQPDIQRAFEHLGWLPTIPLREGLKLTIDYFSLRRTAHIQVHGFLTLAETGGASLVPDRNRWGHAAPDHTSPVRGAAARLPRGRALDRAASALNSGDSRPGAKS